MKIRMVLVLFFVFGMAGMSMQRALANGVCVVLTAADDTVSPPAGSLREKIGDVGCNTIVFNGNYTITLAGTLNITRSLTIDGYNPDADTTYIITVDGGNLGGLEGVLIFNIASSVNVTLQNLTIQNGYAGYGNDGGNIYNQGTLTLKNTLVSNGGESMACRYGGGIYNDTGASLDLQDSHVSGNDCHSGGGGIYNLGTLTISGSTISGNSSPGGGGGIRSDGGSVTVTDSTLQNNGSASSGGGIYVDGGSLTVSQSSLINNHAYSTGGGIFNSGILHVLRSTVANNSGTGAGIYNDEAASLDLTNSTLTGNDGTGLYIYKSSAMITNSTISGNSAYSGGGIRNDGGTATFKNSIVALNSHIEFQFNCVGGPFTDGGHNLEDTDECGFSSANGSLVNTNPLLNPLADNGGPTQTMALLTGSPAIDAGDNTICAAAVGAPNYGAGGYDQRGVPRPQGSACDIGAYELPWNLNVSISAPSVKATGSTYAITGLVTVTDNSDNPIIKAAVTIDWLVWDGYNYTSLHLKSAPTSNTNRSGSAKFVLRGQPIGSYQMCVTNVVKTGWYWDPTETCTIVQVPVPIP